MLGWKNFQETEQFSGLRILNEVQFKFEPKFSLFLALILKKPYLKWLKFEKRYKILKILTKNHWKSSLVWLKLSLNWF